MRESELGQIRVTLHFEEDTVVVVLDFVEGNREERLSGPYRAEEGWLVSPVVFKGKPIRVQQEGSFLVLHPPDEDEMVLVRIA
ncbi:MAG TPA: hypothetical protein VGB85_29655 [Nannocystis sp.]